MRLDELKTFDFPNAYYQTLKEMDIDWCVLGLLTRKGTIISLGSDSKLIGRIFELLNYAALSKIAEDNNLLLESSESQTVYPDFSYFDPECKAYLAVDVKTTYKESRESRSLGFTLGSFASYLRNNTKNICHPYDRYVGHFDVCFIYERNTSAQEGREYSLDDTDHIPIPYKEDVFVFAKERYKLSGEKPGSGNTENIGSFKVKKPGDFAKYDGPFALLGNELFEDYWRNYPCYRSEDKTYTTIDEYFEWLDNSGKMTDELEKKRESYHSYKQSLSDI